MECLKSDVSCSQPGMVPSPFPQRINQMSSCQMLIYIYIFFFISKGPPMACEKCQTSAVLVRSEKPNGARVNVREAPSLSFSRLGTCVYICQMKLVVCCGVPGPSCAQLVGKDHFQRPFLPVYLFFPERVASPGVCT